MHLPFHSDLLVDASHWISLIQMLLIRMSSWMLQSPLILKLFTNKVRIRRTCVINDCQLL